MGTADPTQELIAMSDVAAVRPNRRADDVPTVAVVGLGYVGLSTALARHAAA